MDLSGNTILITGGATGIGLALAELLVARGNEVLICGRRAERLEEAKQRVPQLQTFVADVADDAARRSLAAWATSAFPSLNVLINNAGVQHRVDLAGGTEEMRKAEEEITINLVAPIHLTALLAPHLARQPRAAVVNVSSGLAFAPMAQMPVYCATKAALHSLTMSLRYQLRDTSVRVFELVPPIVTSELGSAHRPPQANASAMPAETFARLAVEALERDEYEAGIGDAANLMKMREVLFSRMNPA